ncbi:MAG TPA: VanW family protein [Acidimicrobiia bacterium]
MNKQLAFRIHPLLAAVIVVGGLFAALFALYGINRWISGGDVIGRVHVAEAELGGRTEAEAYNTVSALEIGRLARVARFTLDDNPVELEPGRTGLEIDEGDIVGRAMMVGREGNFANQFLFWLTNIFSTTEIPLEGTLDPAAMEDLFDTWDTEVIDKPIDMGSITLEDGELVAHYPAAGVGIQRDPARAIVLGSLLAVERQTRDLPTITVEPVLTTAEVEAALIEAQQLLAGPITMTYDSNETVLGVEQLKEAFVSETVTESEPGIVNSFDPAVIDTFLTPIRSQFEAAPVNARFRIEGDTVSVVPGSNGTRIDEVETAQRLYDTALTGTRAGSLPIVEGAEPEVTTEYLESLKVEHLVVQFTTYHDCCEARVVNIQLMADAIDGKLVLPGETFSINDFVGERTPEKGYLQAGSIVGGELVDTYGGGVSQFATTFYNAVFWGGYQDVEHQPHSYWFSRYPEGIEATLFWRSIDVKFRNNREHAILIDTRYTGSSITVRFFGFNHGRTMAGDQRNGETRITVVNQGGPEAMHVKGNTSDRFNITDPKAPEYRPDPGLDPDKQRQIRSDKEGWSVTVSRTILIGGTEPFEEQQWVVRYSPQFAIFEVHPCKMPGATEVCPTTTTTTVTTTTATTGSGSGSGTGG